MPSRTPSRATIRTVELRSISEAMMRVASEDTVHPTVPSFAEYHQHPGVVTVPIRDPPLVVGHFKDPEGCLIGVAGVG
jgi:hypothetical protein